MGGAVSYFLTVGIFAGLAVGLLHSFQILGHHRHLPGKAGMAFIFYRAIWAVLLWTLFGAYLLFFWLLGLVLRPLAGWRTKRAGER